MDFAIIPGCRLGALCLHRRGLHRTGRPVLSSPIRRHPSVCLHGRAETPQPPRRRAGRHADDLCRPLMGMNAGARTGSDRRPPFSSTCIHRRRSDRGVRRGQVQVVRRTRALIFMRGEFVVGDRVVATANGIWKHGCELNRCTRDASNLGQLRRSPTVACCRTSLRAEIRFRQDDELCSSAPAGGHSASLEGSDLFIFMPAAFEGQGRRLPFCREVFW